MFLKEQRQFKEMCNDDDVVKQLVSSHPIWRTKFM